MEKEKQYTAKDLLQIWYLRSIGGPFISAGPDKVSGGQPQPDVADAVCNYVSSTELFREAKDVLKWVLSGKPISKFEIKVIGRSRWESYYLRGWLLLVNEDDRDVPQLVVDAFNEAFKRKFKEHPFVAPMAPEPFDEREGSGQEEITSPTWNNRGT